jgi:hypothetical protein
MFIFLQLRVRGAHSFPGGDIQSCTGPDIAYAQNLFRLLHCIHTKQFLTHSNMPTFIYFTVEDQGCGSKETAFLFAEYISIIKQKIRTLLGFQNY